MKRFKLLLLTLAITISTVIYAEKSGRIYDLPGLSAQIELLLRDTHNSLREGSSVTVFFSLSEEKTIQYVAVATQEAGVKDLLQKKLEGKRLDGEKWREGMIYELSVYGRPSITCISH